MLTAAGKVRKSQTNEEEPMLGAEEGEKEKRAKSEDEDGRVMAMMG